MQRRHGPRKSNRNNQAVVRQLTLDEARHQLEFYFSPANMARDQYLAEQMDEEGFVEASKVFAFTRIKYTARENLLQAVRTSTRLELSEDDRKVRVRKDAEWDERGRPKLERKDRPQEPCKYHAAGACQFGSECRKSHDMTMINEMEQQWLTTKVFDGTNVPFEAYMEHDYFIVLDLEGRDEIIEFPCLALHGQSLCEVGRFHRWVRPEELFEGQQINAESNAVPFAQVLEEFETWLQHIIPDGATWLFVICGDWDIKTQIPKQCRISKIPLPSYFHVWCNLKQAFLEYYDRPVSGMKPMLSFFGLLNQYGETDGIHHLGMHDVVNIARLLVIMLMQGAPITATGERLADGTVNTRYDSRASGGNGRRNHHHHHGGQGRS